MTRVRLEPAALRSQVKHSTTEPLRSLHEHVEMNKLLCSLVCTWITIIDGQLYIDLNRFFKQNNFLHAGLFLSPADFFKTNFLKKFFQE